MTNPKTNPSEPQIALPGPALELSLQFLADLLEQRLQQHLNQKELEELELPDFSGFPPTPFLTYLADRELTVPEFLTIVLALAPHLQPELLGPFLKRASAKMATTPNLEAKKMKQGVYSCQQEKPCFFCWATAP
jgi:hypothetical protein